MNVVPYPKVTHIKYSGRFLGGVIIVVQEKLDGSNVAIRVVDGELILQSRTQIIDQESPQMFRPFVEWAQRAFADGRIPKDLEPILYGETVGTGKLKYETVAPFVLFEAVYMTNDNERIASFDNISYWGFVLQCPTVSLLYTGPFISMEHLESLISGSRLGGVQMEGVVAKAYHVDTSYTNDEGEVVHQNLPIVFGKFVREDFKETQRMKKTAPTTDALFEGIAEALVTEARFEKALAQAREQGKDVTKPHNLIPIVSKDVFSEDSQYVMELLYKSFSKSVSKAIVQRVLDLHVEVDPR